MTDFYNAAGLRLRQAREALDLTEQQAADAFGVTLKTYRKYEAGGRPRSSAPLVRFADKYNVSPDWIFMGEQPMMSNTVHVEAGGHSARLPAWPWRTPARA
jgi:transcriptional regulator with XRE-family HTH domain